jgi:hypothetical protein
MVELNANPTRKHCLEYDVPGYILWRVRGAAVPLVPPAGRFCLMVEKYVIKKRLLYTVSVPIKLQNFK